MKRAALLLLVALSLAPPAEARARKKSRSGAHPAPVRAEDDPRKKGSHPAFSKASVAFAAPRDLSQLDEGPIRIRLAVKGYSLGPQKPGGPAPHAHLIVDNEPALEIPDAQSSWTLTGLAPGPHLVRAVLCRPWHEVVKAPRAFALARFWIGPRLSGKAGKAAEFVAWPEPRKPLLTYVLPLGAPPEHLALAREEAPEDPTEAKAPDPPPKAKAGGNRPVLDFYLSNARVARRGDKIRIVLDKRELPLITEWKPHPLRRARSGTHHLTIDLLNRKGLKVKNAVNRTDRAFTVDHPKTPPRAELGAEDTGSGRSSRFRNR
ncbi:MAG: hypothetical protein ACXWLR_06905 [Myxococcales bacterium]